MPNLALNKKALHDYEVLEKYEAGLVLLGHEVKSAKNGGANLKGSYVSLRDNEAWLVKARVAPYAKAGKLTNYDPERARKLLLHKKELRSLIGKLQQKGLTMVPISMYTKRHHVKVEIGLCRGKREYDKRQTIKKRELDRDLKSKMKHPV